MKNYARTALRGGMRSTLGCVLLLFSTASCVALEPDKADAPVTAGHYVWGAEVNVFSPCGSDRVYWVEAEPSVLQELREQYTGFKLQPYEAVFVELHGTIGPVLDCGFCEAYDGSFRVEELIRMTSPGPEECQGTP